MKNLFCIIAVSALCVGCAHDDYRGAPSHDRQTESGYESGTGTYGPDRPPTPLERDFPDRIEPGATGEPRLNPLTTPPVPDYYEGE